MSACIDVVAAQYQIQLENWIGKYPSEKLGPKRENIWHIRVLGAKIAEILPSAEYKLLSTMQVETKVEKVGGFFVLNSCRPHDCSSELSTIFIEDGGRRIWVAMAHRDGRRLSVRWYASKDPYTAIPAETQRIFTNRLGE